MRILVIGQCTLHWGRMEFGNIGNFYVIDPFFRELRRVFPIADIATTMQFSAAFCDKYNLITVPMQAYYDFDRQDNLENAKRELEAVRNNLEIESIYVDEVKKADLVIDFSGDIWGDNADFLGEDRFATGCYKDLIAQTLKPTIMMAGSPGPFKDTSTLELAKEAYKGFKLVTNREPLSTRLLMEQGFDLSNTQDYPCTSFLFDAAQMQEVKKAVDSKELFSNDCLKIGFMMCGWNFEEGPFDKWPREDREYAKLVHMVETLIADTGAHVYLLSHSNGFDVPPKPFVLKQGRDFPIMLQVYDILCKEGYSQSVTLLDGVYSPEVTKGIISNMDVLISGRMHGAVAGISQSIPTTIIDYGHEPKAHKLRGFSEVADVQDFIADPNNEEELIRVTRKCIEERRSISDKLSVQMKLVKASAMAQFDLLKKYI